MSDSKLGALILGLSTGFFLGLCAALAASAMVHPTDPDRFMAAYRDCRADDTHITDSFCTRYAYAKSEVRP